MKRILSSAPAIALATTVAHASNWAPVAQPANEQVFVEVMPSEAYSGPVRVGRLMRSYPTEQSLGGWYPHRSETRTYHVDCSAGRVALQAWQFHAGTLGHGATVWADAMEATVYVTPAQGGTEAALAAAACAR